MKMIVSSAHPLIYTHSIPLFFSDSIGVFFVCVTLSVCVCLCAISLMPFFVATFAVGVVISGGFLLDYCFPFAYNYSISIK